MKYVVICGDGMSDRLCRELSGKTPLEVADKPNMDEIAAKGNCGMLSTMVEGLPLDSGVANLGILGYDPKKYYTGRGPFEAAKFGLDPTEKDVALRCNTITEKNGRIEDYASGQITSEEARKLIEHIDSKLGNVEVRFHAGVKYRHILLLKERFSDKITCMPPHDIVGEPIRENMIEASEPEAEETAELLNLLMRESKTLLKHHPVNMERESRGLNPANMLWFWGAGRKPNLPPFKDKYGVSGSVISAVDIIKGIAVCAGLKPINVAGATGYLDTDYVGKAKAALTSLKDNDFVYVHVEAPDEAGHEGSIGHKIQAIEDIDDKVLGTILGGLDGDYALAVLPDHATPIEVRTHTAEPVPFAIYDTRKKGDDVKRYTEEECMKGSHETCKSTDLMGLLIR